MTKNSNQNMNVIKRAADGEIAVVNIEPNGLPRASGKAKA